MNFAVTKAYIKDGSGECIIEGYANTIDKDRVGDVVLPTAFEKSLPMYLKNPVLLANHDWADVAGVTLTATVDDKGLFIKARISDTREDIKTMVREGCLRTLSIGYNEVDAVYDEASKTKTIKELELLEISVVAVPANPEAIFTVKKDEPAAAAPESGKKALTAEDYKAFITTVREACGDELDTETTIAACDLFIEMEKEPMKLTKSQMLEKLKSALQAAGLATDTAAPAAVKADPAAPAAPAGDKPAADAAPAADDFQKAVMAKLDAIAQGLVQLMDAMNNEEQAEGDSSGQAAAAPAAEAGKADPAAPAVVAPKAGPGEQTKDLSDLSDAELAEIEQEIDSQLASVEELEDESDEDDEN